MYVYVYIYMYIRKLPALHVFDARTIFCMYRRGSGPSYICIAQNVMERQFGYVSRTCTDVRYLSAQLHGDARTGCGAPLARDCT